MPGVTINLKALGAKFARARERLPDEVEKALDRTALAGVQDLKATTSFNDRTTTLRGRFNFTGGSLRRRLNAATSYAKYLEYGTKTKEGRVAEAHIKAGYFATTKLRRTAGGWVIRPRRFMEHAKGVAKRKLSVELQRAIQLAFKGR